MDTQNKTSLISLKTFILFCKDYSEIKFSENKNYINKVNKLIKTLQDTVSNKPINYNDTSISGFIGLISSSFDKEEMINELMDTIYIKLNDDRIEQSSLDNIKDIGILDRLFHRTFFIKSNESKSNLLYKIDNIGEINGLFSKLDKETDSDIIKNIKMSIDLFLFWYLLYNYIKILLETIEES